VQAPWLIAVMGPTATGKTDLAERLANQIQAQLVNADAFQVYRGMDIGTSKPQAKERYELLDLKDPDEGFGVGEWLPLAHHLLQKCFEDGENVIVVGGTGLYIRALFEEYAEMAERPDPELRAALMRREAEFGLATLFEELTQRAPEVAKGIDPQNPARVRRALERLEAKDVLPPRQLPAFQIAKFAIEQDKSDLNAKIEYRVGGMMQNGWLEEVECLRTAGYGPGDPGFRALGYSALWKHLAGTIALVDALESIVRDTRRYAKRQRSWLRSEPNTDVIKGQDAEELVAAVLKRLAM
jgi:tRNA dimethylallyltransferase